jgi:hypothetical protein
MKIYLHYDNIKPSIPWHNRFEYNIQKNKIKYKKINLLKQNLSECFFDYESGDIFIGRFNTEKSSISKMKACFDEINSVFSGRTFPKLHEYKTYYNNKYNQFVLFRKQKYSIPKTSFVRNKEDVRFFITDNNLNFPIIRKDFDGCSSENVSLIYDENIIFPCLIQEFCRNNNYDIRTINIGGKIMGFKRLNRSNDFRASGSGRIEYIDNIPKDCVDISLNISKENSFISMCYDFIKNNDGKWVILEMSYTYPDIRVMKCDYYYDCNYEKHDKKNVYPQDMIFNEIIKIYTNKFIKI